MYTIFEVTGLHQTCENKIYCNARLPSRVFWIWSKIHFMSKFEVILAIFCSNLQSVLSRVFCHRNETIKSCSYYYHLTKTLRTAMHHVLLILKRFWLDEMYFMAVQNIFQLCIYSGLFDRCEFRAIILNWDENTLRWVEFINLIENEMKTSEINMTRHSFRLFYEQYFRHHADSIPYRPRPKMYDGHLVLFFVPFDKSRRQKKNAAAIFFAPMSQISFFRKSIIFSE